MKTFKVLALAMALPSTILGLFLVLQQLVDRELISNNIALIILVLIILNILFLMVRYVFKKPN